MAQRWPKAIALEAGVLFPVYQQAPAATKRFTTQCPYIGVVVCFSMRWIRPQLHRLAAGWLVCHLCLLASIPTTLRLTMFASTSGAACTCAHRDGQICPMHHTRSRTASTSSSRPCSCRSSADPMTAMAASLIGPAAVLTPSPSCEAPLAGTRWSWALNPGLLESPAVPGSPPPRH